MIGQVVAVSSDGSGWNVGVDLYLDGSVPPAAPFTPKAAGYYGSTAFHVASGSSAAQAQAALQGVVQAAAQDHAALTAIAPNVIGHTVTVAG